MVSVPVVDKPFKRVAIDIMGPLDRSRSGNRYILVLCDYATQYPEAVALKKHGSSPCGRETVDNFLVSGSTTGDTDISRI